MQPETRDQFYIEWVKLRVRVKALEGEVRALQKNVEMLIDNMRGRGGDNRGSAVINVKKFF